MSDVADSMPVDLAPKRKRYELEFGSLVDKIPDWRQVRLADMVLPAFASAFPKKQLAIVEYDEDGKPKRFISTVTPMYRYIPPVEWFTNIARVASDHMQGAVSILSVMVAPKKILVTYKLPARFELTTDVRDCFGLTLVACNPYSGKESHTIGAGALRFVCTNGCYIGEHKKVSYDHIIRAGDEEDAAATREREKIVALIEGTKDFAQFYVDRMVGKRVARRDGTFGDSSLKTESVLCAPRPSKAEAIIRLLRGLTHKQRGQIFDKSHADHQDHISMYDLWNACTYVATRQNHPGSQHKMMAAINDMFTHGGLADVIIGAGDHLDALQRRGVVLP